MMKYVDVMTKRRLIKAICYLQDGLKECDDYNSDERGAIGMALIACCEEMDRLEAIERENKKKAIAWLEEEIDRYSRAPIVNQCDMCPEWQEAIDNYMTAIMALKGEM